MASGGRSLAPLKVRMDGDVSTTNTTRCRLWMNHTSVPRRSVGGASTPGFRSSPELTARTRAGSPRRHRASASAVVVTGPTSRFVKLACHAYRRSENHGVEQHRVGVLAVWPTVAKAAVVSLHGAGRVQVLSEK